MVKRISYAFWNVRWITNDWDKWYFDVKEFFENYGYEVTHFGIISQSYNSGKLLTVARKEKEMIDKIRKGEKPILMSLYSLPPKYKSASFDYNMSMVRREGFISVTINECDYNITNEKKAFYFIDAPAMYCSGGES